MASVADNIIRFRRGASAGAGTIPTVCDSRGMRVSPLRFSMGGRHGSAEPWSIAGHIRRPRSRDRDRVTFEDTHVNVRSGPAGPEERKSWLDALNDMTTRLTPLEKSSRDNTQSIVDLKSK